MKREAQRHWWRAKAAAPHILLALTVATPDNLLFLFLLGSYSYFSIYTILSAVYPMLPLCIRATTYAQS